MDKKKIERAVRMILEAIGEDPDRKGLKETPARVSRMYEEIFSGKNRDAAKELSSVFLEKHKEMILSKDIPFYSVCEHHMLPFFGKVHVAYIPDKKVVGISKLARVVDAFARRLQVQERLTSQVADLIDATLSPSGVAVVIDATHTCMTMRGVQKPGTRIITSAMRGVFRSKVASRAEVMSLINSR